MATYVFSCPHGQQHHIRPAVDGPGEAPQCSICQGPMKRAYSQEGVGFAVEGLKREREAGGPSAVRDLFLPTAAEEATPEDPDGSKAIEKWNEEHVPAETNKNPTRPERPLHSKKVF